MYIVKKQKAIFIRISLSLRKKFFRIETHKSLDGYMTNNDIKFSIKKHEFEQ